MQQETSPSWEILHRDALYARKSRAERTIYQSAAVKALPVTRKTTEEESRKDERVSQVIWMLRTGTWPSKPKEQINSWKALSHEMSVQNGCLYFGHPGMARMKMLARGYVYWTDINRDIEEAARHCRNCQEAAKMPKKT
ncbi:hypothetical protein NECAME_17257, partial [Necator americanus]